MNTPAQAPPRCPKCGAPLVPTVRFGVRVMTHRRPCGARGQALVELALVTPVLLLLILGGIEAGNLGVQRLEWANSVGAMAQWAAYHPSEAPGASWSVLVDSETSRTRCTAPSVTDTWLPDHQPGSRVVVTMTCTFAPVALTMWDGLPVTVQGVAVVGP